MIGLFTPSGSRGRRARGGTVSLSTPGGASPVVGALFAPTLGNVVVFRTAVVGRGVADISPDAPHSEVDQFWGGTVGRGSLGLTPNLYSDSDSFHTPVASRGAKTLLPTKVTDADSFGGGVVTRGAVALTPSKYTDADTFYVPGMAQNGTPAFVQPDPYTDTDTFRVPTVGRGPVTLTASRYASSMTSYTATLNSAPVITSSDTANATLGDPAAFYTITATDAEQGTLTYSITGTDAQHFTVDPNTGAISIAA